MAYTDKAGKTILDAFGKFQAVLYAAIVVAGDLLARDTTNEGFILADQSGAISSECVALEDGVRGELIWMALAAVIEAPPTETGGVFTAGVLALAADVTSLLYLGEDGKAQGSAGGACGQVVGTILSTHHAVLKPNTYLTGTDITITGNFSCGGTLAATGAATLKDTLAVTKGSTLTGAVALDGGATVATGKNFTMVKGNIIFTKGSVRRYVLVKDAAYTVLVTDDILDCTLTDDRELTLPAIGANIGHQVTVIHRSGDKILKIVANGADKILTDAGVSKDNVTDDKGLDCIITLVAVAANVWATAHSRGGWTYA